MSFLYEGQISTNKLVLQFVYIFIVSYPVWAGIKINSSPKRKWNKNQFQPKQEMELGKCTQIVELICQLTADLQRGRTCNSYLITLLGVVCPSSLKVGYQLTK